MRQWFRLVLMFVCAAACGAQQPVATGVLAPAETQKLMPPAVFFQGQTATVQVRNSFAMRFGNGGLVLAGLVDTGGYSSAIRDRYQFYLLTDTTIEVAGKRLGPGSYGGGFLPDGALVMDLAGHELVKTPTSKDAGMTRPRPLQMVVGKEPETVLLYLGRDFVTVRQIR